MNRQLKQLGRVTLLTVLDTYLDARNVAQFKALITQLQDNSPQLVLDLSQVQFLDSPGCGALLSAVRCLDRFGGQIKVCCLTRSVRNSLDLLQMLCILEVYETRDEAIRAFVIGTALPTSPGAGVSLLPQPAAAWGGR
jgi:anti-sigma B factor antagonist